jgi:hypothetical protein
MCVVLLCLCFFGTVRRHTCPYIVVLLEVFTEYLVGWLLDYANTLALCRSSTAFSFVNSFICFVFV